jgi:hypothetical protein
MYNIDTRQGMAKSIAWTEKLFDTMKDGAVWAVPRSGMLVRVSHKDKTAYITKGLIADPSIPKVIKAMGWTVITDGGNND